VRGKPKPYRVKRGRVAFYPRVPTPVAAVVMRMRVLAAECNTQAHQV